MSDEEFTFLINQWPPPAPKSMRYPVRHAEGRGPALVVPLKDFRADRSYFFGYAKRHQDVELFDDKFRTVARIGRDGQLRWVRHEG